MGLSKSDIELARVSYMRGYIDGYKKAREPVEWSLTEGDLKEAWEESESKKICEG